MKRRRRYRFQEDAGEAGRNRRPHASATKTPTANAVAGKCAEFEASQRKRGASRGTLAKRGAEIAGTASKRRNPVTNPQGSLTGRSVGSRGRSTGKAMWIEHRRAGKTSGGSERNSPF
jgi:hypothetical protein